MEKYVTLVGLGVVGSPLANHLYKKYGNDFALLSSEDFLHTLTDHEIYMNGELFAPKIFSKKTQLDKKIGIVFICVKNYHIKNLCGFLKEMVDEDTVIFPLQNGVYSFDYFRKNFPNNPILEGFAQGPNTQILGGSSFVYQKPGTFHIGTSIPAQKRDAEYVFSVMKDAGVQVSLDEDIKYQVWKKLMLNVAGNAITALTDVDYCMFYKSAETQELCRETMREFIEVAKTQGVFLSEEDIKEIIAYYLSFKVSKKTSMLEDVSNKRPTENPFLAGYISDLARKYGIPTPRIDTLFRLIKIKEDVYLKRI